MICLELTINKKKIMRLLSEELIKSKYLFGYKPGVVISEQDEILLKLKRRAPEMDDMLMKILDDIESSTIEDFESFDEDFPDEYTFVDSVILFLIEDLKAIFKEDPFFDENEDEIEELLKDLYHDEIIDFYSSITGDSFDDEEDIDF